jgi:hypothetical protein
MTSILTEPLTLPAPLVRSGDRPLVERLASRVAASVDELAVFQTASRAVDALAESVFAGKRVTLARPAGDRIARVAWGAARSATEVAAQPFDTLVAAARESDVLVLTSPLPAGGRRSATITPRELLLLRSRAPRPVIVLDLLEEDFARTPLTQPALLLPGTLVLRVFGQLWRDAGATNLSDIAFVAGPRDLIASLSAPALPMTLVEKAGADLDLPGLDRRVQEAAALGRPAAT